MKRFAVIVATLCVAAPTVSAFEGTADAHRSHEIRIQKGRECWSYQGKDRSFVGQFLSWQNITVEASSETHEGLRNAKVKVYNLSSGRVELLASDSGSYPTPEGANATLEFDVQVDPSDKVIHFNICAITERMATTAANVGETYLYACELRTDVDGHVVKGDDYFRNFFHLLRIKNDTLVWRGKTYHITKQPDCAKSGWHATGHGISFDFCIATDGVASIFNSTDDLIGGQDCSIIVQD
jgi:hypothetical protein